ncbi:MAG: 16S rRNA (cytidine(1402)-2'-O)-methyltransferase [Parcubacteria group bacterium]|nr:16S rRNA (cytidine(1402)-2'-O)-methyltransferase [Parcubacteria group bacterium]
MGNFYVVATPIGNLEDITLRALRVLKEVDVIVCEDTRVTKRLLERYEVKDKQLTTYNERQSGSSIPKILAFLNEGKNVALVSDAGTPTVSDPGAFLINKAREAGATIISIPGPNAAIAALSISGLPSSDFLFLGFLPHKKGRETLFKEIAALKRTVVFYESPHRIMKALISLKKFLTSGRKIFVARELTKIYEEGVLGTADELIAYFEKNKEKIRGEFVVLVEPL